MILFASVLWFPLMILAGETGGGPELVLEPNEPGPGDVMIVTLKNAAGPVAGTFNGKGIYLNPSNGAHVAIVGIDLGAKPGAYGLDIKSGNATLHRTVNVVGKEYPIQHLTLPKDMVELSPENEARVERDQKKMAAIWPNESGRVWAGNFINPLEGKIVTLFGVRRIINKIPKNSHTGVDVSGEEDDPVRAPNAGIAVLVDDQFYSGRSLVLDHGQGIFTMFFHLSKILVRPGQVVKKGDQIAQVGSTGRSTGPHLHWGVRVQGAKVDPQLLIKLKLE